ncbi:hypothetical protein MNEG_8697 [Monoraphidium neglectum]|uniref:MYND-type domain-containing protein n=1 Tax=Monoraphidium neglectum TaxID=145388 RepID=A0A0D2JIX6_9CHLO|nr:hypothetical protein MNEG_8697 [Monoraphidium neglectum]KIY99267.1 hypothetical protein MNEG_8697 [Monoraphidium neglectum]|eukprot:XP_013898287.1 hypothetical protein MNEG_8697 [Monoraphidium neglectum]
MDLNRLMTCKEVCAAALQVPRFLDALCEAAARYDGCDSLTPLHQLLDSGGLRVAVRAAREPGLLHAAARVAGGGAGPKAGAALGFLAALLQELGRVGAGPTGPADGEDPQVARENVEAATPAIADAAARGVLRLESPECVRSSVVLLEALLRADGTRPAAALVALAAPPVVPSLLRLMMHPDSLEPAAGCIALLSRLEPGRAELMKTRPATLTTLAATLRRTAAAGDSTPRAAACVVRAVVELIQGDKAAAAAFLDIALPGSVLPALAHHMLNPDGSMCHGAAAVAAALAEAAEAAGPQRLAAVAAAPGLLAAVAAAIVRAMMSPVSAPSQVRFHALDEMLTMDCDEAIMPTVGDLVECLDRLTAAGAAAAESIVGVEGLEAALTAVAANPAAWARMDATAAAARVLRRLRGAAAEAAAGEVRGQAVLSAVCATCGRMQAEEGVRLRLCRGCGAVRYCSEACARKDWVEGSHKQACKPLKKS